MNTPAVTIVAAWISAETGVGPSMASGSQVWSRNCADLPIAPMKRRRQASVSACHSTPRKRKFALARSPTRGKMPLEGDRAEQHEDEEDAEREAEIADPVDDEGLDGRGVGRVLLVPEADQEVAREADALPAEEHLDEVVGRHQHQHGEGEERQIGEEARPVRILVHVADRVEVHERRDRRHDDQHHGGQRVDPKGPVDHHVAGGEPLRELDARRRPVPKPTSTKAIQDRTQDRNRSAVVTISLGRDPMRRPNSPAIRKPTRGRKTMAWYMRPVQPFIMFTSSTAIEPRLR